MARIEPQKGLDSGKGDELFQKPVSGNETEIQSPGPEGQGAAKEASP